MPAATSATATSRAIPALLVIAVILFGTGVFFPFFHVTKFWLFDSGVSVVGGIITLFQEGEYFLFAVLTLFTLVFPCAKLGLLAIVWLEREHDLAKVRRLHGWVESLGKWSMLDVFVVAILIVAMKSAAVAEIHIGSGLYLFTFSVVATQFASAWVARHLGRS
jgi:paraquat-inducible protein A